VSFQQAVMGEPINREKYRGSERFVSDLALCKLTRRDTGYF